MKWRVEVLSIQGSQCLLRDLLAYLSVSVVEEDGKLFLLGERFEIHNTPAEAHAEASRIQSIVNELCQHSPKIELAFSVGGVVEERAEGAGLHHRFLIVSDPIRLRVTGHEACLKLEPSAHLSEEERKRLEAERSEQEYQQLLARARLRIVAAFNDERALTVERLLQGDLVPFQLGHIVELIEDDLGRSRTELASAEQWSRFDRSIGHPDVFGEQARHIVSHEEPPPHPMSLTEAQEFIRGVSAKWLSSKAGSDRGR